MRAARRDGVNHRLIHSVAVTTWKFQSPGTIVRPQTNRGVSREPRYQRAGCGQRPADHPVFLRDLPVLRGGQELPQSKGRTWTEVRIDLDPAERNKMVALAKRTSVPQIFVGDVHVGGYDDMMAMHRAGKLEPLLAGNTGGQA